MAGRSWWSRVRAVADAWRADRAAIGARGAMVHRIRHVLDLGPVTGGRVDLISEQLREVSAGLARLPEEVVERAERLLGGSAEQIWVTTRWLEHLPVEQGPLVSVIMPTRGDRPELLRRAVDSILAQHYGHWELLVVYDGATPLPPVDDPRIRTIASSGSGVAAARNTGIAHARGDLVAYCDDDNTMDPMWLKAVVWAAGRAPHANVFYGAQLVERGQDCDRGEAPWPVVVFELFDRRRLETTNFIDQGVLAHRRDLTEAAFDETLAACVDWDQVLRLTAQHDPIAIPVVASHYRSDARDRISGSVDARDAYVTVAARARAMRPLRVLAFNGLFPLISETYIGDELEALAECGAEIACCAWSDRPAPMAVDWPVFGDLDEAVREFDPDVLLVHWAQFAKGALGELDRLGIPFACRLHSFDTDERAIADVAAATGCIGIWAFPQQAEHLPAAHRLPTLFTSYRRLRPWADRRDLVLATSAGLPKKDWPVLLDAYSRLRGVERRVVVGATDQHLQLPTDLMARVQGLADPPLVQVNLTRDQVFDLLARTTAFVYTLEPTAGFGNPTSVIEALCAGVCVIAPDRPEAREMIGPGFRGYRSADDIVRHVHEILAGGPAIDAEREQNAAHGRARFADPELQKRFFAEMSEALSSWQARQVRARA